MTTPSHATEKDLVLQTLSSSEQTGLSAAQVTAAREPSGWNELATVAPEPAWKKFLAQFSDVVVWILIAAAVISGAMGEWTNTAAILAIVLLNALLGFFQEAKAERSLAALQKLARCARCQFRRKIQPNEINVVGILFVFYTPSIAGTAAISGVAKNSRDHGWHSHCTRVSATPVRLAPFTENKDHALHSNHHSARGDRPGDSRRRTTASHATPTQ